MLDAQGSLHLHHFRREAGSQVPFFCSDLFNSCRSESSAESNPNLNPVGYSNRDGRSDADLPCSLDAADSNTGELDTTLNLSKSAACHCCPVTRLKAEDSQSFGSDRNNLRGDIAQPVLSVGFGCASATDSSSISPIQETETGTWTNYGGELDEAGKGLCIFINKPLEISRSGQTEERCDQTPSGHEMCSLVTRATSCAFVTVEQSVGLVGEAGGDGGACKVSDVNAGLHREISKVSATSSGALECISNDQSNMKPDAESGCSCTIVMKESDDSSSQSVCTEEIVGKDCSSNFSSMQNTSSEVAFPTRTKRLRISNDFIPNEVSKSLHLETPYESENENSKNEHQPYLRGLDDNTALKCFAFVPVSALGQLTALGRQYRDLVKSRLIFKLRRMYGMVEHLVFIYTTAGFWTAYDAKRNLWRTLPTARVNDSFNLQDRESLSAGTHVLWFGKEAFDFVSYRYDLVADSWQRGPPMLNPRCLFGSASCGEYAYVAGGFGPANDMGGVRLLNSAEKYNSVTAEWELLPPIHTPRQKCSGFFMDGKFYVIGGRDADHQPVMSGEEYDPVAGLWREIPNMYFVPVVNRRDSYEPSPPLVAVVNNHLYAVENTTNILKMYDKHNNTWINLGYLPVHADLHNGWGVAFKALGDRLFLMGDLEGITAYSWQPGARPTEPDWKLLCRRERGAGSFLYNCAVMNC